MVEVEQLQRHVQPVFDAELFLQLLQDNGFTHSNYHHLDPGLRQGVDLGYTGPFISIQTPNLQSANNRPHIMQKLVQKELQKGRFLGPFSQPPLDPFRINPIGFVPKKEPNEFRLISDLSQPANHSVNFHIPKEASSVQYPTIQSAIDIILILRSQGHSPVLFKMDIKSAFRLLPVSQKMFALAGIYFQGSYYIDAFLPMGCSSSCAIFQTFSDALVFLMKRCANVDHVLNYLDDYLGIAVNTVSATSQMAQIDDLVDNRLKIPFNQDKREGPAPVLCFTGIELDCQELEARLPQEKITKALRLIDQIIQKPKVGVKKLQSLHGYLNYCASIIPAGRAFLRSLGALMFHTAPCITVPDQVILDLGTWKHFLLNFNGRAMFIPSGWEGPHILSLETDSSGSWGCAAIFQGEFFAIPWPEDLPRASLSLLEFYPIVVATHVWHDRLKNGRLKILSDNQGTVEIINKLKSRDNIIMQLVREFALQCLQYNIWFQAFHIPGKLNLGPDALSRGQFRRFRQRFPSAREIIPNLPPHMQPGTILR